MDRQKSRTLSQHRLSRGDWGDDEAKTAAHAVRATAHAESGNASGAAREEDAGAGMVMRHAMALFVKRAKYFGRDRKAQCCQVLLPVLVLLFGSWGDVAAARHRRALRPEGLRLADRGCGAG